MCPAGKERAIEVLDLAHLVKTREEVGRFVKTAVNAGAIITDAPRERGWGGYSAYIKDPDGFSWEIVGNKRISLPG